MNNYKKLTQEQRNEMFNNLLLDVEASFRSNSPDVGDKIDNMGYIIALSVLKKLINACDGSQSIAEKTPKKPVKSSKKAADKPTKTEQDKDLPPKEKKINNTKRKALIAMQIEILEYGKMHIKYTNTMSDVYCLLRNQEGDTKEFCGDDDLRDWLNKTIDENWSKSGGLDVKQDACLALWDHLLDLTDGEHLTSEYKIKNLKKQVYTMTSEEKREKEVRTTHIKEIYKYIRLQIEKTGIIQSANNQCCYLEDTITKGENEYEIYYRLGKYSNIAGEVTDFNGAVQYIAADRAAWEKFDKLLNKLHLSPMQYRVLMLRIDGKKQKEIADILNITINTVKSHRQRIEKAALSLGLAPDPSWSDEWGDDEDDENPENQPKE